MRLTLKKLIMSAFAAVILLPGVSTISADAQHRHWRATVRVIRGQPVYPVYYYPVYNYPVYSPYLWPVYVPIEPYSYLQEKGYEEGRDEGKDDAEDGRPPNPAAHKDFYKSYSPVYRRAFIQGYYDEYRREIMY
jgi:hypothetical protein